MISDASLRRMCSAAVMSRAQRVAQDGSRLHVRRCRYDREETILSAKVDATYSWDGPYRTSVVLDEDNDAMVDYDCSCPAALRFAGPCKHSMALAIDFNRRPELFEGYDPVPHRQTSRGVLRLIERASGEGLPVAQASSEEGTGTVDFELTITYEPGFSARFRLIGARGTYVLKSISNLVADVEAGAFRSYGQKLAFTHNLSAFTPHGRDVVRLLMRAIQNRRAYSYDRVMSRGAYASASMPGRDMRLSAPELWDLLELYLGRVVLFADQSRPAVAASRPKVLRVVDEDPPLDVGIHAIDDEAYSLDRPDNMRLVSAGGRALAWDGERIYCCSDAVSRRADLLSVVFDARREDLVVVKRDLPVFCATVLPRLEEAMPVSTPAELDEFRPIPCEICFYLDRTDEGVVCSALARYGEVDFALVGPAGQARARKEHPEIVRDQALEAHAREVARRYFQITIGDGLFLAKATGQALAAIVFEGVDELRSVGTVYTTPSFDRLRSNARPSVRVGLSVRSNLLDLSLQLEGLPESELSGLLSSYRLKRKYHRLRDGSYVDLSKADLATASGVVEELGLSGRDIKSGTASVPAYKAFLLEGITSEDERDDSFEEYLDRIHAVDLASYEVPASLANTLRSYQVEGFRWLCALAELGLGGILADEMGLGKSLQFISLVLAHREQIAAQGPALIVCPASLVYNWQAEFDKFAPELRVRVVAGAAFERSLVLQEPETDVLVTSYDLLRRDVQLYDAQRLWCVVLDEAQYIKNHETLVARAVKRISSVHRFALTGTPVENRLSELWSIFDFLMPGLLGSYDRFRKRYERPIVEDEDEEVATRLRSAIKPFVLRREKSEVLQDLPDKIEQVVSARMDPVQQGLYDAHVQQLLLQMDQTQDDSFGKRKIQILAALTRLRQICCDPSLLFEGYDGGSCKTETILTLVERVIDAGEKMLLFSQFTSFLEVISSELDKRGIPYYVITGSTPKRRRLVLVDKFNADETPVFLISLKAGGTGLNLVGAQVVIHADPWWNEAAQNQATDRAHRIGQTSDVTVYKVIVANTIEERILELQRAKSQLADAVVGSDVSGASLSRLTREDLEDLLA